MLVSEDQFFAYVELHQHRTQEVSTPAANITVYLDDEGQKIGHVARPNNGAEPVYDLPG